MVGTLQRITDKDLKKTRGLPEPSRKLLHVEIHLIRQGMRKGKGGRGHRCS